jgi:carboxypeptidase Q
MILPRRAKIAMLGLGTSVPTPEAGITAEILVVTSFDDLETKRALVPGKIVLYNPPWTTYSNVSIYRVRGASSAAKYGAAASLVRSLASFSIRSPHTGSNYYADDQPKIPTASISTEDADMIARIVNRGQIVTVTLKMACQNLVPTTSHNVYGDFKGSKYPNEIILLGGHMDSWDVGTGAMDDLGGAMVCYEAVRTMIALGIRPLRTVRFIGWTGEELGSKGALTYNANHKNQLQDHILALESDGGTWTPYGLRLAAKSTTTNRVIAQVLKFLCVGLNTTLLTTGSCYSVGQDTQNMCASADVPSVEIETDRTKYFWYHHSNGDMPSVLNASDMDKNAAMIGAVVYAVANLQERLPKV